MLQPREKVRAFLLKYQDRVLYATDLVVPPLGVKHVATLHDLALLRHPERFRPWHKWSTRKSLERLHRTDRIICISRFTADEAMALLNLPHQKLEVVHNGCEFHPDEGLRLELKPVVPDIFQLGDADDASGVVACSA